MLLDLLVHYVAMVVVIVVSVLLMAVLPWAAWRLADRLFTGDDDEEACNDCGRSVDDHDMRSLSDPCQRRFDRGWWQ